MTRSPPSPAPSGKPNLKHLRKQAKALLRAHKQGDVSATRRLAAQVPRLENIPPDQRPTPPVKLSDAQLAIARENSFSSWPKLQAFFKDNGTTTGTPASAQTSNTSETPSMIGKLARVIVFTSNMEKMIGFYHDVLGLKPRTAAATASDWFEFDAGGCNVALHKAHEGVDTSRNDGMRDPHKLSFYCPDIPTERQRLIKLGVAMGKHHKFGELEICDGPDPDGNLFQLCNR